MREQQFQDMKSLLDVVEYCKKVALLVPPHRYHFIFSDGFVEVTQLTTSDLVSIKNTSSETFYIDHVWYEKLCVSIDSGQIINCTYSLPIVVGILGSFEGCEVLR